MPIWGRFTLSEINRSARIRLHVTVGCPRPNAMARTQGVKTYDTVFTAHNATSTCWICSTVFSRVISRTSRISLEGLNR